MTSSQSLRLGGLLEQEALECSDISLLSPAVKDVGGGCTVILRGQGSPVHHLLLTSSAWFSEQAPMPWGWILELSDIVTALVTTKLS